MCEFVKPDTVHILGGAQQAGHQPEYQANCREQPDSKPSQWGNFKFKAKRAWNAIVSVAKDIKENFIPILIGVGAFLSSWATFCNRSRSSDHQRGTPA